MLFLKAAGLVYLANPKTATQSIRAMLGPYAGATPEETKHKHVNAIAYGRKWAPKLTRMLGAPPQTVAVMREPLAHLGSWFRYRQRDDLVGHENSTRDIDFATFIQATLSDDPPPFARIGRQDRFLGFLDGGPPVNHIFDYDRLDLLMAFLSGQLGTTLSLPLRNVSPTADTAALTLPVDVEQALRTARAAEFALHARVAATGHLVTPLPA